MVCMVYVFFWSATLWLISRTTDVAFIDLTCRRLGEQGVSQLICRRVRHPEIRNVSNKHGMSSNQHLGVYQHGDGLMILKIWLKITFSHLGYPLGNKHSYWKWWFIVDSPIKGLTPGCRRPPVKGGCFLRFLSLGQAGVKSSWKLVVTSQKRGWWNVPRGSFEML